MIFTTVLSRIAVTFAKKRKEPIEEPSRLNITEPVYTILAELKKRDSWEYAFLLRKDANDYCHKATHKKTGLTLKFCSKGYGQIYILPEEYVYFTEDEKDAICAHFKNYILAPEKSEALQRRQDGMTKRRNEWLKLKD